MDSLTGKLTIAAFMFSQNSIMCLCGPNYLLDLTSKLVTVFKIMSPGTGEAFTVQARAQQLAEVAVAVYEAGCSAIHLPLEASNPLLAILKQALDRKGVERAVGQNLASALLEDVLQAVDAEADSFPPLIVIPCCVTPLYAQQLVQRLVQNCHISLLPPAPLELLSIACMLWWLRPILSAFVSSKHRSSCFLHSPGCCAAIVRLLSRPRFLVHAPSDMFC